MATKALRDLSISLATKPTTEMSTPGSTAPSTSLRSLDTDPSQGLNNKVNSALSDYVGGNDLNKSTKTIMETFAARAGLAKEGGIAERKLTDSTFGTRIADQLDANASEYTSASEGRSGFATQTAAVRMLEDTGGKRIRDLEKSRDELLLQSKIGEASRLDSLINDEQTAITNARKTWIENLLMTTQEARAQSAEARAVSQENRDIAGFETPEQARTRDLVSSLAGDSIKSIQTLATTAPDAGIVSTDTFDQAVAKYRNSTAYKQNVRLGELEIQKAEADIANTRSITSDRNNPAGGDGTIPADSASALGGISGNVLNMIPSENGKKAFTANYNNAKTDQQRLDAITTAVVANSPVEVKTDFISTNKAMGEIDMALGAIERGAQTGYLNNASQYAFNMFGKDYDPKLAEIRAHITAAIQPYRNSVTGAAWGSQEESEYQSLFGSTKFSPTELSSRLTRLKGIMQRGQLNIIKSQVSPFSDVNLGSIAYPVGMGMQGPGNKGLGFSDDF